MNSGKITLIIGPMFSGKTSRLCNEIERHHIAKKSCIIVKHTVDTRYNNNYSIVTHSGHTHAEVPVLKTNSLKNVVNTLMKYDIIGIDEVQFFQDYLTIHELANNGKVVIASGLDGNYLANPFGKICELIPLAEEVIKLKAVCMQCYGDASFTKRLTYDVPEIIIGGDDKYTAVCRKCMWNGGSAQV